MSSDLTVVARLSQLTPRTPTAARAGGIDLVVVRETDEVVHVLQGRCPHRGALLADGRVDGPNLICGVHQWDYRLDTGISAYNPAEQLARFPATVVGDEVLVETAAMAAYRADHPDDGPADVYDRLVADAHQDTAEEPFVSQIHALAAGGLAGAHGPVAAMGVPRDELPRWDDIQIVTAQLARFPLLDDEPVDTTVTIGPAARRPLRLDIPMFVSDMSFGALSAEAKTALARGAQQAGTGICSGEGGMLPEEQAANERYLYELASGRFGWREEILDVVQAVHLKLGQGAKTGTGGHLPGHKVVGRIAQVRGLPEGTPAVSPARFPDWTSLADARELVDQLRERSGGIPVGVKMSAQHIEADLDAALGLGIDYVILDGRGGGTGAAPLVFRDTISVPTMPALARARRHLDAAGATEVTLVATGGLRTAPDLVKALALGADAVALSNVALQAIGCVGMRACHTDNCPVGIATQQEHLRARLPVERAAAGLARTFTALTELMTVLARACGHRRLADLCLEDLTTWRREIADLAGIPYAGVHR